MIKGKSVEEIRKVGWLFETLILISRPSTSQMSFTPEEEQIRKENEWCEDR